MKAAKLNPQHDSSKKPQSKIYLSDKQMSQLLSRFCALGTSLEAAFAMLNLLSEQSR